MTTLFSTNETVGLERNVEIEKRVVSFNQIFDVDEQNRAIKWIKENDFNKVCLQFSDDLLCHSTDVVIQLKKHVDATLFVLGDTSYGSCCVDEIAAAHVACDALIHFGHACLSKVTRLPVLYIFSKYDVDVDNFVERFRNSIPDKTERVFIFYDVSYYHAIDAIADKLRNYVNLEIGKLAQDGEPEILCWSIKNNQNTENATCVYIGDDNQSFFNILMTMKCRKWILYDADERTIKEMQPTETKWLKRRYYYIEKCKDAQIIGIVVGTLTSKGYLDMVKHIQELCKKRNRKSYIFSVGKVNPAKLANFLDIDCFVLIGCPENTLYNSRDFYKPIVSIFEVEMALNPAWHLQIPETYSTDFRDLLPEGRLYRSSNDVEMMESDVSLVTGKIRGAENVDSEDRQSLNGVIQERSNQNQLAQAHSTVERFQNRSFKGLDPALGKNEPSRIEKGRSGIAIRYEDNSMEF